MAARSLADAWRAFVRHARRSAPGVPFEYTAVFEATKNGWPHLHIACRSPWVDQGKLSEFMAARISSPIVDVRAIDKARAVAAYVAKYLGKHPHRFETAKRYWSTPGYLARGPRMPAWARAWHPSPWRVSKWSIADWAEVWNRQGLAVEYDGEAVIAAPPGTGGDPPIPW